MKTIFIYFKLHLLVAILLLATGCATPSVIVQKDDNTTTLYPEESYSYIDDDSIYLFIRSHRSTPLRYIYTEPGVQCGLLLIIPTNVNKQLTNATGIYFFGGGLYHAGTILLKHFSLEYISGIPNISGRIQSINSFLYATTFYEEKKVNFIISFSKIHPVVFNSYYEFNNKIPGFYKDMLNNLKVSSFNEPVTN